MKRAIPVVVLSIAGLVPVWLYQPSAESSTVQATTPAPSTSSSSSSGTSGENVVTSSTITTEKGPVQLQVTFDGTKITAVKMLQQPNHPQTTAAVPKLVAETLQAQSADIDTVSGATITSEAYKKSLQATIDDNAKSASASPSASASEASSQTVDGSALTTEKGPVQVQVTFGGTKITAVKMLQQPNHPQTTAAVPVLVAETLQAQSADIDTVSGATITSEAYKKSLQAAIDARG
ncbi:FMN-binding protein [Streptomyces sp. NBC_00882]|uniref:FMN-binding protein n=1 Tax=Streptomyces TaxID=1883 RepID=UPI00386D750E|nr:FMN-binding protein [Streptomyces canus]WSZ34691.1 FMN-binding protein [Streptomyces sp. NBC_00882]WSZ61544.1 FMN-binding protein [Streptomyces canus]